MSRRTVEITPELMLRAYRHGLFPMAAPTGGTLLIVSWLAVTVAAVWQKR